MVRTSPKERNLSDAQPGVGIFYRASVDSFITGVIKVFRYEKSWDLLPWVEDVPRAIVQAISVGEILGALVLILPVITGIYSWLTPVASVGLALLMLFSVVFHLAATYPNELATQGTAMISSVGRNNRTASTCLISPMPMIPEWYDVNLTVIKSNNCVSPIDIKLTQVATLGN